ncbi:MAG: DUF6383 domain-containing protein [Bacteroidales bacterium]|nr:DUF6383 domain-containing protein [Bacteroidales bacterium]
MTIYVPCNKEGTYRYEWSLTWHQSNSSTYKEEPWLVLVSSADKHKGTARMITRHTCSNPHAQIGATANEGYCFVRWSDGDTNVMRTVTVTSDTTLIAYFEADGSHEGIDYVEDYDGSVSVEGGRIVVRGANGMDVLVFDVMGRCVARVGTDSQTEPLPNGIYLVKISNHPARKVAVVR